MKEVLLLVVGALLGWLGKALLEPRLAARSRRVERRERWLEGGIEHAEATLGFIRETRGQVTPELGFDLDQIARAILRTLTAEHGPEPLSAAAEHESDDELQQLATKAEEAWRATRVARMDDQHDAVAASELEEPMYALQWYETALGNFVRAARRRLAK